jgi:hypothetical protein
MLRLALHGLSRQHVQGCCQLLALQCSATASAAQRSAPANALLASTWIGGRKHQQAQLQGQGGASSSSSSKSQAQYKIIQYSKGNQTTLTVAGDTEGDYALQKFKGAATPDQIAAFSTRQQKGAQKAAASAAETSLLLRPFHRVKKVLQATFLPAGYPTSVGSNYLQYTLWQAVTNFATTANGVLASTFLLYSVGLGAGAIPTAGALNWVLKDGLGQMGTLLFGKAIAHNFDIHSKTWYFMSFLLLSTATGEADD